MSDEKLVVAIDFDGTIGADPECFRNIIDTFKKYGHHVVIVTNNYAQHREDISRYAAEQSIPVFFAESHYKAEFVALRGIDVDIWVDDNPHHIGEIND